MPTNSTAGRGRRGPVLLEADEIEAAGESARLLRAALDAGLAGPSSIRLLLDEPTEQQIVLPRAAARLLAAMLAELANGTPSASSRSTPS